MATAKEIGALVEQARVCARLSQRGLAERTDISQATLSRIIAGDRTAKMPELIKIAWATGQSVARVSGVSTVAERAQCAARATNGSSMDGMRSALLHFLELDDYLEHQGIACAFGAVQ